MERYTFDQNVRSPELYHQKQRLFSANDDLALLYEAEQMEKRRITSKAIK